MQMEPDHSSTAAGADQAGIAAPVGRGRQTTVPSWVRGRAGGSTLATGGSQQDASKTAQRGMRRESVSAVAHLVLRGTQGGGPVTATTTTHPGVEPPPEECGQQTTTWVRESTGPATPACQPGRLQQQAPCRWRRRRTRPGPLSTPLQAFGGVKQKQATGLGQGKYRGREKDKHNTPDHDWDIEREGKGHFAPIRGFGAPPPGIEGHLRRRPRT